MKNRSIFVVVLSLLLSIPFFSFSAFGMASEEDEEKKVLYFHVGAPKTGTKAIQCECMKRREELANLGVFYPPPANDLNHYDEIQKVLLNKVDEVKKWVLNIKAQSKPFQSIFLSDECSAEIQYDARFQEFLTFLNQHFRVKYIYCVREIVPTIGSHLTMNIMSRSFFGNIDVSNIDDIIKSRILQRINSYNFYSRLDTTFLSYEELTKSGKFVQTFLQQAMGLEIEIPDSPIHAMGNYRMKNFTDVQLAHLETIFSVEEGSFSRVYRQPKGTLELCKVLSSLIRERTKKILSTPIWNIRVFNMGEFNPFPSSGFSGFEDCHRWTEGTKATMTIPLADISPSPSRISFLNTAGLVTDSHSQRLIVKVNGKEVHRYVYTLSDNNHIIDIPLPEVGPAKIEFEIPDAISPFDLGNGTDERALGILFREVQLNYPEFHMGKFIHYPSSGFSDCQLSYRWTEGKKTTITVPLADMEPLPSRISFLNTRGFVTDSYSQSLIVKVDGKEVRRYVYTLSHNNHTIDIPLPKDRPLAKIKFEIPNAISPSELGTGTDDRKLGIAFREVQLSYPTFNMGKFNPFPSSGFSDCELSHRWTEGKKATMTIPLADIHPPLSRISFLNTTGLVTDNRPQRLIVKVNDEEVNRYVYTLSNNDHTIDITLPKAGPAKIEFEIPDAISPFDLGINADTRILGILFGDVQLNYPTFNMGEFDLYPLSGFSAFELSHRWTEGKNTTMTIPLARMTFPPSRISFLNTGGFVTDRHTQNLIVKMNGKEVAHYFYTLSNNDQTIEIPLPQVDLAKIEFEIPNAISPLDLGISADTRELGIAFKEVKLQY